VSPIPAPPLIDIDGLVKAFAPHPLRVRRLTMAAGDRCVLTGLDAAMAELFVHLVTGAAVPDEGTIVVDGHDTRRIATDAEWLRSLDRFGLVSDRAVLLDGLSIEANLALPLTVSIEPVVDPIRARVRGLATEVGLDVSRLTVKAATLSPVDRTRVHLARALAPGPRLLLLEHPTRTLEDPEDTRQFGLALRRAADTRGIGWLAVSNDRVFAAACGGRRLRLEPDTGDLRTDRPSWLTRLLGSSRA
jgi:predicted ABC-type transport system involved in lysophospholipase L1 biosynthesis ATPase subunit